MESETILKGWDEFAEALGVTSATIQKTFETAAYGTALAIRTTAQGRVRKRTYVLMNSIIAEPIPGGAQTTVMEIYGTYLEYGTGLYDPRGPHLITPKQGKVMAWKAANGQMAFAAHTKGMKAQPFWNQSVEDNVITLAQSFATGLDAVVNELAHG